ncbi:MAG: hypothetical protein J5I35_00450, partial [Methanothrix harundinacea]|nr:hypothetical protein [Methanothrix harundinacea]
MIIRQTKAVNFGGNPLADDAELKFTQADVDRIVQERLSREKAKYADYDEIKAENMELKTKIAEAETTIKAAALDSLKQKIVVDL